MRGKYSNHKDSKQPQSPSNQTDASILSEDFESISFKCHACGGSFPALMNDKMVLHCPYCGASSKDADQIIKESLKAKTRIKQLEAEIEREREITRRRENELKYELQKVDKQNEARKAEIEHERRMQDAARNSGKASKSRGGEFARSTGSCCGIIIFKSVFGILLGIGVCIAVIMYLPKILELVFTYKLSLWAAILKGVFGK